MVYKVTIGFYYGHPPKGYNDTHEYKVDSWCSLLARLEALRLFSLWDRLQPTDVEIDCVKVERLEESK